MVCLKESALDKVLLPFSRRVFILGPSHHVPLSRCALSPADIYRTPLYDLRIDQKGIYCFHCIVIPFFVCVCCSVSRDKTFLLVSYLGDSRLM